MRSSYPTAELLSSPSSHPPSLSPRTYIDAYLSHPWLITDYHIALVFLPPLLLQLLLAYLLFSPHDTALLRRILVVPILAFSVIWSFSFVFKDPVKLTQSIGLRNQASWFYLRAAEIGMRRERPVWRGYETDRRERKDVEKAKRNGKIEGGGEAVGDGKGAAEGNGHRQGSPNGEKPDQPSLHHSHRTQFINGLTYFFAFRLNLGWSNSLANPTIVPPFRHHSRPHLIWHHLVRAVGSYVVWDISMAPMEATPVLRTFALRSEGSIWDPIKLEGLGISLSPFASALSFTLV